jgi:hypothetical protein
MATGRFPEWKNLNDIETKKRSEITDGKRKKGICPFQEAVPFSSFSRIILF